MTKRLINYDKQTGDQMVKINNVRSRKLTTQKRSLKLLALIGAVVITFTACSSTTKSSTASTSARKGESTGVARAAAFISKYLGVPTEPSIGPKFDAKAAAGKLIYLIPIQLAGFNKTIVDTAANAAKLVGAHAVVWPSNGSLTSYQQGVDAAITARANVICLEGVDPSQIQPQLAQARAKGIKITLDIYGSGTTPVPSGFEGGVNMPFSLGGELEADYAIMQDKGNVHALVLTSNDIVQTPDVLRGLKEAFSSNCPKCTLTYANETVATWPNFSSATSSALLANPDVNYVIPLFDNYAQFALSGISLAGRESKVKMDSLNGTPSVLSQIKTNSVVQMDIGVSAYWLGYAEMNNALRVALGDTPVLVTGVPRVFDLNNIAAAGNPPSFSDGYGSNLVGPFKAAWGLG